MTHANKLVIVRGDPGTGKSHLVHWLMRRCGSYLKNNGFENTSLNKVLPIIVQRGNGTLKNVLTQIIHQLPEEYTTHLEPVRKSIENLKEEGVKEKISRSYCV